MKDFATPELWAPDQLDTDISAAIDVFRRERFEESAEAYPDEFDKVVGNIETLLEQTVDLSTLAESARDVVSDASLLEALRYLAGPPISADDFRVLVDIKSKRQLKDPDVMLRIVETIRATLDKRRFPWIGENRPPTEVEKQAAIMASAALMASQHIATWRRNEAKRLQEKAVKDALAAHGLKQIPTPPGVRTHADGPKLGEFCGETMLGSRKADIVVRLWDNRLMPIECKVSNSFLNSVKRINNDAAVKARIWSKEFGDRNVVPTAVISGVFKRSNIESAQNDGLVIIWAHRLADLTNFIDCTLEKRT